MMKAKKLRTGILLFVFACYVGAFLIFLHQWINWGVLFETGDFLHHENFAMLLIYGGIIAMVIYWLILAKEG